jgi:ABC-type branched-subunit amino acid transport system permease subunit
MTVRRVDSLGVLLFAGTTGVFLALMPVVLAPYPLFILSHILVFSIACLALNLLYGTAGSLSLGHATYFGVAAYTGAFLYRFTPVSSFELYLLPGVVSSTVFAAGIGFFCVRTTKIFFAMLTLAFPWWFTPSSSTGRSSGCLAEWDGACITLAAVRCIFLA